MFVQLSGKDCEDTHTRMQKYCVRVVLMKGRGNERLKLLAKDFERGANHMLQRQRLLAFLALVACPARSCGAVCLPSPPLSHYRYEHDGRCRCYTRSNHGIDKQW